MFGTAFIGIILLVMVVGISTIIGLGIAAAARGDKVVAFTSLFGLLLVFGVIFG